MARLIGVAILLSVVIFVLHMTPVRSDGGQPSTLLKHTSHVVASLWSDSSTDDSRTASARASGTRPDSGGVSNQSASAIDGYPDQWAIDGEQNAYTIDSYGRLNRSGQLTDAYGEPLGEEWQPDGEPRANKEDEWDDEASELDEEQPAEPELSRNQAISGRVLDQFGMPVTGIGLIAGATRLFDLPNGAPIPPEDGARRAVTDSLGLYTFQQLAAGDYKIRSLPTPQYSSAKVSVRAGTNVADIVLEGQREVQIFGQVTSTTGEPLPHVRVSPVYLGARGIYTDAAGQYALAISLQNSKQALSVSAELDGFREQLIHIDKKNMTRTQRISVNFALEPVESLTLVRGVAVGADVDAPLAGAAVQLQSRQLRQVHRATTANDGLFTFPAVEPGDDYQLVVRGAGYQDYTQNVRVTLDGLDLRVALEPELTGQVYGQIRDLHGKPIPHFRLALRSQTHAHRAVQVTSDANGYYFVEHAPAGALLIESQASPRFLVSGAHLAPGGKVEVPVILDWGQNRLRGLVLDSRGSPVSAPNVVLSWFHVENGVRSSTRRQASADAQGYFLFDQLGPGAHAVQINVPGFKPAYLTHDITMQGYELVVRLEEKT